MPNILHQKLEIAKNLTLSHIEVAFQKLEKEMLLELCEKQEIVAGPNLSLIEAELKVI